MKFKINLKISLKKYNSEKGSVFVYSLLVMIAVMVVSVTLIRSFIPKFIVAREAINSSVAIYTADSAIEWCLYSNRRGPANVPPQPVMVNHPDATYQIYRANSISVCPDGETVDYRVLARYRGINRSFQVNE